MRLPEVRIKGKVYVDELNIYDKGVNVIDTRKKMGLLAQRPCPLPMSIFDNVAYGPRIHGIRRRKSNQPDCHPVSSICWFMG